MAKIVSRILSFAAVADAAAYKVYVGEANSTPSYDDPNVKLAVAEFESKNEDGVPRLSINLADLPLFDGVSGARDVNVTALDAAGNESDFLEIDNVLFDFDPPAAPTAGRVDEGEDE